LIWFIFGRPKKQDDAYLPTDPAAQTGFTEHQQKWYPEVHQLSGESTAVPQLHQLDGDESTVVGSTIYELQDSHRQ